MVDLENYYKIFLYCEEHDMQKYLFFMVTLVLGSSFSLSAMVKDETKAVAQLDTSNAPVKRIPTLDEEKLLGQSVAAGDFKQLHAVLQDKTIDPTRMQIMFRVAGGGALVYSLLEYAVSWLCGRDVDANKMAALSNIIEVLLEYPFNLNSRVDIEFDYGYGTALMLDLFEVRKFDKLARLAEQKGAIRTPNPAVREEEYVDVPEEEPEAWWLWRICCFCCWSARAKRA